MKKILLVTRPICPPWDEASKNFAYYLAKNIKNIEVHILTNGILPDLPQSIIQENIYDSSSFGLSQKMKLIKFLRKNRGTFDIVHYLFTPTKLNSFLIKTFAKLTKGKTIQTIATLREDLYSDEDLKKILFADLITTYSDYSKNELERLGFGSTKRIYPGIDIDLFYPAPKSLELLKKFGFASDDFVINFTGEYTRLGAIDDVINSFIEISKKIPNAKLSLAVRIKNGNDAQKKNEVAATLKNNNIFNRVSFQYDGSYEMQDIFNLCDVSIFPVQNMKGKFDVPLAIIEAMSCEKPVIISDLPILREFANDQNSVTIEAGKAKQLSEKILDVYEYKDRYVEIGKNARKYVVENFDIKKVAEKYQEIYKNL
ncbi:MAG: glycosyltransferase family 4 protein [Parcubacteria group bacterium]|jgi:glycosyltransferase involved in cell wall biosynthesis